MLAFTLDMSATILVALLLALVSLTSSSAATRTTAVTELDGGTFRTALQDHEVDLLVLFHDVATRSASARVADLSAEKLNLTDASSIRIALYDVATHGVPAGMHVHGSPTVILFPATGRDSQLYEWAHDDASFGRDLDGTEAAPASAAGKPRDASAGEVHVHADGSTCSHDHAHGHGHGDHDHHDGHADHHHPGDHSGQARLTAVGLLNWLHKHTTFPAEAPEVKISLADRYQGKSEHLWAGVARGLDALQTQMSALQADNERLRKENDALLRQVELLKIALAAEGKQ